MTRPVVFLGPSLPRAEAQTVLDAEYEPPARAGDVIAAVARGARVIGIIDGFFEQVPAVRHKEILYALSKGVVVLGASSMGALRAAELCTFGMEGVGAIFEAFRTGELEDDDEVAVSHGTGEVGFRPLSDAMVSIRFGLRDALAANVVASATHDALVRRAKARFYAERSWKQLWLDAGEDGLPTAEIEGSVALCRAVALTPRAWGGCGRSRRAPSPRGR